MRKGFTLVELLVVIGIIAMMITLLLPVLSKVRAASNAAACLSNLRQMAVALNVYHAENRGRLLEYVFNSPAPSEVAWNGYWLGVADRAGIRGEALKCPSARESLSYNLNKGAGTSRYAWTGRYSVVYSTVRLNPTLFREGSYGYNKYLTAKGGYGPDGLATKLTSVRRLSDVPAFFDCVLWDAAPVNGSSEEPVEVPMNFEGVTGVSSPDHWRFLLNRHGRAINVSMADGSARAVRLSETYSLHWRGNWVPYQLPLPVY